MAADSVGDYDPVALEQAVAARWAADGTFARQVAQRHNLGLQACGASTPRVSAAQEKLAKTQARLLLQDSPLPRLSSLHSTPLLRSLAPLLLRSSHPVTPRAPRRRGSRARRRGGTRIEPRLEMT